MLRNKRPPLHRRVTDQDVKKSAITRVGMGYKNECKAVQLCGTNIIL